MKSSKSRDTWNFDWHHCQWR